MTLEQKKRLKIAIISLAQNDFRYPIIGLNIVTKYLINNCKDIEVRLIDRCFEDVNKEVMEFNPDIIGISSFTQEYPESIKFAKDIKKILPNVTFVIGGPHITTLPESLDPILDYGVIGEGHRTMVELILAIRTNKGFGKIKGLVYFKNKKIKINKKRDELCDIDEMFPLDYSLLNKNYFKRKLIPEINKFGVTMGIMTSIGCPYDCRFCSIRACWKKIRFRKVDSVVEEIKDLYYNYKVRHIDLFDDLFSINIPRLKEFREKLKEEGLLGKISFTCQGRVNTVNPEILEMLKSLNIKTIVFGFESGSDRVLKYIKKDNTLSAEMNRNAVLMTKMHGMNVYGGLMMAIPTEKLEDMDKTLEFIDYAIKNGVSRLWTQILIPLPATEVWEIAKKRGKLENNFYENIPDTYNKENPLLLDPDVPLEEFQKRYALAKKKCRPFVYKMIFITLKKDPLALFYFSMESLFYLKRLFKFLKQ
jgi:anaerobic magnesium-protoporphyrin IX monomethyl ester cyclase